MSLANFSDYRNIPYKENIEIYKGNVRTFQLIAELDRKKLTDLTGFSAILIDNSPDLDKETNDYIFKVRDVTFDVLVYKENNTKLFIVIDTNTQIINESGKLEDLFKKGHHYLLRIVKDNMTFVLLNIAVL